MLKERAETGDIPAAKIIKLTSSVKTTGIGKDNLFAHKITRELELMKDYQRVDKDAEWHSFANLLANKVSH